MEYGLLLTLSVVMTTLEGWIPTGTVAALDFSTVTRSTWMTHFLRYTWDGQRGPSRAQNNGEGDAPRQWATHAPV